MLTNGQRLGEFEIIEPLGKGGMGEVYKARQLSLERFVALKTLQGSLTADADYIARFRQEALAAAGLSHPNLVQVHSAGESDGLHWFAMEYIEGESAKVRLQRKGWLDPREAVAIAIHVATALDYGWRKAGLIHRDIKPDNIFLSNDGEVKLGDLGLAKSAGQNQGLTQTGHSMGTPLYMSPEQAEAMKTVDFRADIYSLGCTLYHLLSGLPPYEGNSGLAIMMKHANAPVPDLRSVWKECPAEVAAAVTKMIQKQPDERQQSYEEVNADLRRAFASLTQSRVPSVVAVTHPRGAAAKPRRVPVAAWAGGGVALLAALAFFLVPKLQLGNAPGLGSSASHPPGEAGASQTASFPSQSLGTRETANAIAAATKDVPFVNSLGMKFVPVPILGGPTGGQPQGPEPVEGTVLFSVWDTRVQDYEVFVKETKREWPKPDFEQGPTHPAVMVSWEDAQLFCQWLTMREQAAGRLPAGFSYRLPSDHEWSCAVGIGAREDAAKLPFEKNGKINDAFPWGTQWPPPKGAGNYAGEELRPAMAAGKYNIKEVIAGYNDGFVTTSPVGSFAANQFGLFDMGGNVIQWCEDWFEKDQGSHLLRGAPWRWAGRDSLLLSTRTNTVPGFRNQDAGFRCVLAPASSVPAQGASSAPATATRDQPFVNGLGMNFVPVPILGGPTGGKTVLFSVWDTRVQDYKVFVKEIKREWPTPDFEQGPTHPAVNVSWEDAQLFCQWLTGREQAAGRLPAEWRYRLPSDHEWSCAVGIGAREDAAKLPSEKVGKIGDAFPWGTQWPPPKGAGNYAGEELRPLQATGKLTGIKDVIPGYHDGYPTTSPVGSYAANSFGLYDMGGNVWQWCQDWFDIDQKDRVHRGASLSDPYRNMLLSSFRARHPSAFRCDNHGFRCVLAPTSSAPPAAATPVQASSKTTSTPTPAPPATPKPLTEVEKWLAEVDGPQQATFQKQVLKPFETGVAELRARYLASLDAAIAKASAAGQLTDALAWRTERQAFEKAQNVAPDDEATPPGVKMLRAPFRQQLAKLDQNRATEVRALLASYDAALAKYETLLTQRQRLDDALLLKTKREEVAKAWLGASPVITISSTDHAEFAKPVQTTTTLAATKEQPFVNGLGMKFVPVPITGGPTGGTTVYFSVWDTRVQDYQVFVDETQHEWPKPEFEQGPTHPVVNVSWEDAQLFCQWLTVRYQAAGRLPAGWSYRLPTDHEWSCAVGIGAREDAAQLPSEKADRIGDAFPWGTQWPPPKGAGNYAGEEAQPALAARKYIYLHGVMSGYNDGFVTTSPVGSFAANRFGLFDMGGNVQQWCEDWFDMNRKGRAVRGAAWNHYRRDTLLSSHRGPYEPGFRIYNCGFRCVLAASAR